ncbi:MAG: cyclase family protein [Candidatus Caldarchaeum sp.]|nr:cyclase family protein [Candidatus Caldarchaeum sp.]MDW8359462.1 cyclase family protein [Candidatus Caldarchaeum sp.]
MEDFAQLLSMVSSLKLYDLGQPYFDNMPVHPEDPPFMMTIYKSHEDTSHLLSNVEPGFSYSLELVVSSMHSGTHIDALCHMARNYRFFRDVSVSEIFSHKGFKKYDSSELPVFVKRCVLIDVASFLKRDCLPQKYEITANDLLETVQWEGITLRRGDVILIRTGYAKLFTSDHKAYLHDYAGISLEAAEWIVKKEPSLVGIDNLALSPRDSLKIHLKFMVDAGIYVIKNMNLETMAQDKVFESLFIAIPLKVIGATGSLVRPIALAMNR